MADITINITTLDETQILADLNRIAQELGIINEINETSNIYIYYSVFARVFGNIAKIITQYLTEMDIYNTTDEALLELLIQPFVKKRQARTAKVILPSGYNTSRIRSRKSPRITLPNVCWMIISNASITRKPREARNLWPTITQRPRKLPHGKKKSQLFGIRSRLWTAICPTMPIWRPSPATSTMYRLR